MPKLFDKPADINNQQLRVIEEINDTADLMRSIDNATKLTDCLAILAERGKMRDQEHGERLMATIVDRFNSKARVVLSVHEGYEFMKALKLVRFEHSHNLADKYDSLIDLLNYTALQGESRDDPSSYR